MDCSDLIHVKKAAAYQREVDRSAQLEDLLAARMQELHASAFHPRNQKLAIKTMGSIDPCVAEAMAAEIWKARLATSNQQFEIQQAYANAARMLEEWLEDECAEAILNADLDEHAEY